MEDLQTYLDKALKEIRFSNIKEESNIYHYDVEKELRELIVSTRTRLGITQKQLAEKSGISQANISRIENGNYRPSIPVLKRMADAFGKRLVIDFINYDEVQ